MGSNRKQAFLLLLVVILPATLAAHTLEAPPTVIAASDGSFNYIWLFTVGPGPMDVAGFGWWGVENVFGGGHVDCFCYPPCTLEEGETLEFFVSGLLTDPTQDGIVDNWVAGCTQADIRVDTRILAPNPTSVEGVPSHTRVDLDVAPNPFRSSLELTASLDGPANVVVEVLDVTGRSVSRLYEGAVAGGASRFEWDGRDAGGNLSPAGVYFVRLRGQAGTDVIRKVTRLR